ncbi:IclR family transcriptional regulator [Sulfitobacter geojensis]|uniref:IclR family transcriptional regulator n=1 Tax=Sulfitobacter geojensis TaxID=1342299 RepID=A0AAE3B820_9RHOB|nr:IclR family transcriptional regulator [Sulfitobacter geojensis]MBM1691478.1 IclR family transcriptional regulator [Sulfitobacter geojensis]MBM1695544.1 IclR family transcriptional regulator [Sulfitobacter geojensis]MBM1707732.1 IclR family transcriptional regulator [Sulfitobacter geojensis]MBM1711794.1 IclR family transcriptional regulator [Sulfitobacter geojensis]MBM1715857.1 IclR family transcriptional regulator [Sulfitobacter geojensis]
MADDLQTGADDLKDRNFVTALARGLELLRCFRTGEVSLSNSDFSERTGLPKATIFRLTHTLCALDYLVADSRAGTYRLSAGVLHLGFSVLSAIDIGERAKYEMRQLRDGPNTYITVALGEQHDLDVIYLVTCNSREGVALSIRIGTRLPLFDSGMGQAILVGMHDDAREAVFEIAGRESKQREADGRARFAEAKSHYEDKGFCTGYGTWRSDVNGIAVPVFSLGGARVYGLNVGGPSFHVKPKQLENTYAPRLIKAGETLSIRSGNDSLGQ